MEGWVKLNRWALDADPSFQIHFCRCKLPSKFSGHAAEDCEGEM